VLGRVVRFHRKWHNFCLILRPCGRKITLPMLHPRLTGGQGSVGPYPLSDSVTGSPVHWGVWSFPSLNSFGSGAVFRRTAAILSLRTQEAHVGKVRLDEYMTCTANLLDPGCAV